MSCDRKISNILIRKISPVLFEFGKSERFKPDQVTNTGTVFAGPDPYCMKFGGNVRIILLTIGKYVLK